MADLLIRPGVLDRLKTARGINTDKAMADLGGTSLDTYIAYKERKQPTTAAFIANICLALGLGPGEVAEIHSTTK